MHKKTSPQSVCHWSWWLNSHVLLLSTLQSVPRGPDVLTAVLLLWQNNTSGFVSGACGKNPQDLVPPLLSSCSFCTVQNEPAVFEPLQCQNSRFGHSQETHLEELTFIPLDTKPVHPLKVLELLHKELYHQPFLVFSRHIWSPETLLILEQHFSLICHCF